MIYRSLLDLVGDTPVVHLRSDADTALHGVNLFAKLEGYNPTGSSKDRPAAHILRKLLQSDEVDRTGAIIESSSGNFGVALAAVCRAEGLRFICVVDPLITPHNRFLLAQYGAEIEMVDVRDDSGGYLKGRVARVQELVRKIPGACWINQYANEGNAMAHYFGTGMEIYKAFVDHGLDYVFVPVSSGGTIAGVSRLLKKVFPDLVVVAVDAAGSVIFGGPARRRFIPGMGSSRRPELLDSAQIDEVVVVDEEDSVRGCLTLLRHYGHYVGGSSGAAYHAARQMFSRRGAVRTRTSRPGARRRERHEGYPNALVIFPDRGDRYADTLFDQAWVRQTFPRITDYTATPEQRPSEAPPRGVVPDHGEAP